MALGGSPSPVVTKIFFLNNVIKIHFKFQNSKHKPNINQLLSFHTLQKKCRHKSTYHEFISEITYRVSQEEGTKLLKSVPYVKIYRYNPKHLYPNLNGYGDNGQRKVWSSCTSTHCTSSADSVHVCPRLLCQITEIPLTLQQ